MKIVVLGGTGFIGGKVVNLLRACGHELVAASPSQEKGNLSYLDLERAFPLVNYTN